MLRPSTDRLTRALRTEVVASPAERTRIIGLRILTVAFGAFLAALSGELNLAMSSMGMTLGIAALWNQLQSRLDPAAIPARIIWLEFMLYTAGVLLALLPLMIVPAGGSFSLFALSGVLFLAIIFVTASDSADRPVHSSIALLIYAVTGIWFLTSAMTKFGDADPPIHRVLAVGALTAYLVAGFVLIYLRGQWANALQKAKTTANRRLNALEHARRYDPLTGAFARPHFDKYLAQHMHQSPPNSWLMAMDLDGFKPINDQFSRAAGDYALVTISQRLRDMINGYGMVARIGGDEFMWDYTDQSSHADPVAFARAVQARVTEPIAWQGTDLRVGASIGIVPLDGAVRDIAALQARADRTMRRAKSSLNERPLLWSAHADGNGLGAEGQKGLRRAMEAGAIAPHYQPKVDPRNNRITGAEALARWQLPDGQVLMPKDFMTDLTHAGLLGELALHSLIRVITDLRGWLDRGLAPGHVSINLPEPSLATQRGRQELLDLLAENRDITHHLTFEITENVLLNHASGFVVETIAALRDLGCRVSLDDFGTGYASLRHLRELDFDEIKIDRSFVMHMGGEPRAEAIVTSMIDLALELGLDVVSEGVETSEQATRLADLGCHCCQGYLWSPACPATNFARLLRYAHSATVPDLTTRI